MGSTALTNPEKMNVRATTSRHRLIPKFDSTEHRIVDDVHIVAIHALAHEGGASQVLNLLDALQFGEDEVRIAAHPHCPPRLVVVVVLALHQFESLVGISVI